MQGDASIKIWDFQSGALQGTIDTQTLAVLSMCLTISGSQIISGHIDNIINIWDFVTKALVHTLDCFYEAVVALCVSSDGNYLVSGDGSGCVKVWDLQNRLVQDACATALDVSIATTRVQEMSKPRLLYVLGNTGVISFTKVNLNKLLLNDDDEKILLTQLQESPFMVNGEFIVEQSRQNEEMC